MPDKTILLVTDKEERLRRFSERTELTRFELDMELQEKTNIEFIKQGHKIIENTKSSIEEVVNKIISSL